MDDTDVVKNYQDNRDYLVLNVVKKYPLYSLDKLAELIPDISRHSIQNILERHNLSTVQERVYFSNQASQIKIGPRTMFKKTIIDLLNLLRFAPEKLVQLPVLLVRDSRLRWRAIKILIILIAGSLIIWQGSTFVLAKPPAITVDQPASGFKNEGDKLFVKGKVSPVGSQVKVNGNVLALNGDGSFTGVVNIPLGESILRFTATYKGKKSELLRIVNRIPTDEELKAKEDQEKKKKVEMIDKAAEVDRTVKDLLAAQKANVSGAILRIINNHLKEEAGLSQVVGEVVNIGSKEVGGVMITANFLNPGESVVDTRYGFATDFGQVIKPGETAKFVTQATNKPFDHYSLDLTWQEATVAGLATEAPKEASPSATPKPSKTR